jgi:tetratricopeptide (TPR) repeat protein
MKFDDPNRAKVYYSMARVYRLMGKYEHAIEYFRRAMLLQRQRSSSSDYRYADTLSDLAVTYSQINNTSRAIRYHLKALDIFRKILGENDLDMPLYYTQLAYTYWRVKQYEDAHTLLVKSLSILKADTRSNLAGLCPTKHTMGLVKCALGQREEGMRYLYEALELRRKLFANDHPSVGRSYYDLANIYMETGDVKMALEYAQNAFIIYQAKLPESHADLKSSLELVNRLRSVQAHYTTVTPDRDNFEQK